MSASSSSGGAEGGDAAEVASGCGTAIIVPPGVIVGVGVCPAGSSFFVKTNRAPARARQQVPRALKCDTAESLNRGEKLRANTIEPRILSLCGLQSERS